jgi:hypothetical protein
VTVWVRELRVGDSRAIEEFSRLVYHGLHQLARNSEDCDWRNVADYSMGEPATQFELLLKILAL